MVTDPADPTVDRALRPAITSFDVRITDARIAAPSVRWIAFERVDGQPMQHAPGQWINLLLPLPSGELKRAYSIASAATGTPGFELAVTRVAGGPGSGFLHEAPIGTTVRAVGPQGFFTRVGSDPAPALFVATGTGIAPIRAMIQAAIAAGSRADLRLLFGVRREEDILFHDEWRAAERALRTEITLSRAAEAWSGARGYVQTHVERIVGAMREAHGEDPHVFVCGLEKMVSAVRDLCRKTLGIERRRVHAEKYD